MAHSSIARSYLGDHSPSLVSGGDHATGGAVNCPEGQTEAAQAKTRNFSGIIPWVCRYLLETLWRSIRTSF